MFTALIAFVFLIVGLVTGYIAQPRVSRKISYKKRGKATRQRAAAKRAAKPKAMTMPVEPKDAYANGSTAYKN